MKKVILEVNKRPRILGRLEHSSFYVGVSRVRMTSDMRFLPPRGEGLGYLKSLKPSLCLGLQLPNGYKQLNRFREFPSSFHPSFMQNRM
jgi:hypothetical protein